MPMDLYYTAASSPCRLVLLTAAALDLPLNLKNLDFSKKDHLKPEFVKINAQHTVPTLVDDDFVLWESRSIARYLVNKQAEGSALYPRQARQRALVDQRLDFDLGTLYPAFADYYYPLFRGGKLEEANLKKLEEKLALLDTFLAGSKYAAGEHLTLADLALVATVSTVDAADISFAAFPNILRWYELVKETAPGYQEVNQKGVEEMIQVVALMLKK